MENTKKNFFFDHIPKTAGMSLDAAFRQLFPQYKRADQLSNWHEVVIRQPGNDYVSGHFNFIPNEMLLPQYYYCTVLRDPVRRFISQYFFNRQVGSSLLEQGAIGDKQLTDIQVLTSLRLNISEYVRQSGPIRNTFANNQALHFAARVIAAPELLDEQALFDAAIASLEGYDLIGTFDNLQGFVNAVARDFQISPVPIGHINATRLVTEGVVINDDVLEFLVQANAVDYKILDWASERFSWKVGGAPKSPIKPVERVVAGIGTVELHALEPGDVGCGDMRIRIVSAKCRGECSGTMVVGRGEKISVDIDIEANIIEPELTLGIAIRDREGKLVYGVNSLLLGKVIRIEKLGPYRACIQLDNPLGLGAYSITLALHKGLNHTSGCYHWFDSAAAFAVSEIHGAPFEGSVDCRADIFMLESPNYE